MRWSDRMVLSDRKVPYYLHCLCMIVRGCVCVCFCVCLGEGTCSLVCQAVLEEIRAHTHMYTINYLIALYINITIIHAYISHNTHT